MNRYTLWKYIVIAIALVVGLVYALPNLSRFVGRHLPDGSEIQDAFSISAHLLHDHALVVVPGGWPQNAVDVYHLDTTALGAIAREIDAPTLDELATPIDAVPEAGSVTAFRSGAGGWSYHCSYLVHWIFVPY